MYPQILKIIIPSIITFVMGILITPFISDFLYSKKMWKKKSVETTTDGHEATITKALHNDSNRQTPRMGGIIVWGSVILTIFLIVFLEYIFGAPFEKMSFFSRSQTWIPLATLILSALFGLIDDYLVCNDKGTYRGGGLSLKIRLLFVIILSIILGLWFFTKLELLQIHTLFSHSIYLGYLIIPLVSIVLVGLYSGGIIDGIDGLSGGIFASMFSAYGFIAYSQGQFDIAALCLSIVGGILAFLWFNIPPARFFLSETGSMSLTLTLGVVAFLTDQIVVLSVIALPLFVTAGSSLIQILSKKFRGKKILLVAPLHNHFQAIGWPPYKVVMRYWIISVFCSITGIILAVIH